MRGSVAALCVVLIATYIIIQNIEYAVIFRKNTNVMAFRKKDVAELLNAIECGEVCRYDHKARAPSKINVVPMSFNCPKVFLRMLAKCPAIEPPPKQIPANAYADFTMNGTVKVVDYYLYHRYSGAKAFTSTWKKDEIDDAVKAATMFPTTEKFLTYGKEEGTYVERAVQEYWPEIRGKVGIVWGSQKPWVEVILARAGAKHIVTVEYGEAKSEHPDMTIVTPATFAAFMLTNRRAFDFAATFSSLEHSGLGRYGDALDPFGDLQAAAETWCALRPGGLFFVGLPSADPLATTDELHWTAHRYYGQLRLAQMFRGYQYLKTIDIRTTGARPTASIIHVLRKPDR